MFEVSERQEMVLRVQARLAEPGCMWLGGICIRRAVSFCGNVRTLASSFLDECCGFVSVSASGSLSALQFGTVSIQCLGSVLRPNPWGLMVPLRGGASRSL